MIVRRSVKGGSSCSLAKNAPTPKAVQKGRRLPFSKKAFSSTEAAQMQNITTPMMRGARPAPLKTCHTPRNSVAIAESQPVEGFERGDTQANRWRHLTRNCACNPYGDLEVLWRRSVEKGRFNIRLDEATTLFLNGETETAKLMLRDLINATLGFEQLAQTVE